MRHLVKHMGENSEFEAVNIEIIKNLIDLRKKVERKIFIICQQ